MLKLTKLFVRHRRATALLVGLCAFMASYWYWIRFDDSARRRVKKRILEIYRMPGRLAT